jgi:aspartate/methionine/tyrosine aminotransferase
MSEIPGVTVAKPKAALYLFPKLDPEMPQIWIIKKFLPKFFVTLSYKITSAPKAPLHPRHPPAPLIK